MADIMGSGDLAWYQWKKHGRCSGMPADAYFDGRPPRLRRDRAPARPTADAVTADALEAAFIAANPGLDRDALSSPAATTGCRRSASASIRGLAPRPCGPDVLRAACRERGPLDLPPVR